VQAALRDSAVCLFDEERTEPGKWKIETGNWKMESGK
jgi:anti-sigma28 factor (negative regulator of flagellin synthesis)